MTPHVPTHPRLRKGDRVEGRRAGCPRGFIADAPEKDRIAGWCCYVDWDNGSTQLCLTSDLRKVGAR